mmetsp:Transcript_15453/g.20905  ORF Transcript_15453/g.20905 Transcript_15453/m.20905 type:complete len:430 (-) Transcript_15453:20-1309(-)
MLEESIRRHAGTSIDLHVVAVSLLHRLRELLPNKASRLGLGGEALLHAGLHALQAAHVDVRVLLLHQLPELIGVLSHLRLDVHLLARSVRRLTRHSVVEAELVRVVLHIRRVLVIVEQGLRVRHTHEEPRQALELAGAIRRLARLVVEEQAHVGAHGRNARARGKHDDVRLRVLRQQHLRTRGAGDQHIIAHTHVADVVRAHTTVHLVLRVARARLVRLVLANLAVGKLAIKLHHALHAQRHRLGGLVITHRRGGNGVQTDLRRRLALLVRARSDDANGLALKVRHLAVMVEGQVGRLPVRIARVLRQGLRVHIVRHHLARVRRLGHEDVPRDLLAMHNFHALLLRGRSTARDGRAHSDGGGRRQRTRKARTLGRRTRARTQAARSRNLALGRRSRLHERPVGTAERRSARRHKGRHTHHDGDWLSTRS